MSVGGDDDTLASSLPTAPDRESSPTLGEGAEIVGGRYRVVRWLGGGGMGRVYEALDTELDERVALKVLRSGLSEEALERFRREVKLTRRIQHRNVCRMFDIGEHKGERFLTMELVDGEPLSREIGDTPMPWTRLKPLAEQICAGLAAAHAAGVVHRDLKPDNVLVERGTDRAVLTDFGIARSGDDPSVTQVGAIVGTPRYMAPEQLAGTEIDARADLFALGVMLFELATGYRPWTGDNAIAIAVSQATTSPRTIDTSNGALPPFFAAVVAACLQLDPADRPASAADIGDAIANGRPLVVKRDLAAKAAAQASPTPRQHVARAPASPTLVEPTSIAVLPLACAPGDEYLADGLFEDLTDTLSTTPGVRVRPSGIVRSTAAPDPREVGQRLQVDHVVAGSLRRAPNGLRIATRLISVADGFQIWAHKTDCSEAEVLTVADELARGIADALSSRATSATKPTDPRAVDLYLRARAELRRFWGTHAAAAADLLEQAVQYAPTSAPILAAHAYACVQAWVMRGEPDQVPRAKAALERALASGHGEAFLASAQYRFNVGEPEVAAADLARALSRTPMSAQSHELAAKILIEIDGTATARKYYDTARGLDPGRTQIIENDLARVDALDGDFASTERRLNALRADPDPSIAQLGFVSSTRMMLWRGDRQSVDEATATFMKHSGPIAKMMFKMVEDIQNRGTIDTEVLDRLERQSDEPGRPFRQVLVRHQLFVELATALGHPELALVALESVAKRGLLDVTWMDRCPLLVRLSESRRYHDARRIVAERASRVLAAFRSHS